MVVVIANPKTSFIFQLTNKDAPNIPKKPADELLPAGRRPHDMCTAAGKPLRIPSLVWPAIDEESRVKIR